MDINRFYKLEATCTRIWLWLARTGKGFKPRYASKFRDRCPACEIAYLTASSIQREGSYCHFCPVNKWRRLARKHPEITSAICDSAIRTQNEIWETQVYYRWRLADDKTARKEAAAEIAKLKWTFLKVYEKIKE